MRKPICNESYPINVMEERAFAGMFHELYGEILHQNIVWKAAEEKRIHMEESEALLRALCEELGRPLTDAEKETGLHTGLQCAAAMEEAFASVCDYTEACEVMNSFIEANEAVFEDVRKGKKFGLIRGMETARSQYHRTVENAEDEYRTVLHDTDRIIHYLMEAFQQFPLPTAEMEEADPVGVERMMNLHLEEVDRELERYLKRYIPEPFFEEHSSQLPSMHMNCLQFTSWFRDHTGMSVMDAYESVILSAVESYRQKAETARIRRDGICSEAKQLYEAELFTALVSYNELESYGSSSFGVAFEAYHKAADGIPEDNADPSVLMEPFEVFREELTAWL